MFLLYFFLSASATTFAVIWTFDGDVCGHVCCHADLDPYNYYQLWNLQSQTKSIYKIQ